VDGKVDHKWQALARLPPTDQVTCLHGLVKIHPAQLNHTFEWTVHSKEPLYETCPQPRTCQRALLDIRAKLSLMDIVGLETWGSGYIYQHFKELQKLCKGCSRVAENRFKKGRETFWELLPSCFGLPTWEELEKEAGSS